MVENRGYEWYNHNVKDIGKSGFGLKAYDENGIQGALLGFVDP